MPNIIFFSADTHVIVVHHSAEVDRPLNDLIRPSTAVRALLQWVDLARAQSDWSIKCKYIGGRGVEISTWTSLDYGVMSSRGRDDLSCELCIRFAGSVS